jgi:hypothetical protein
VVVSQNACVLQEVPLAHSPQRTDSIQLRQAAAAAAGIQGLLKQAEASAAVRQAQRVADSIEVVARQLSADMHTLRAEKKALALDEEKMQLLGRSADVQAIRARLVATTTSEQDLAGRRQDRQEALTQQNSVVQQLKLQVQYSLHSL